MKLIEFLNPLKPLFPALLYLAGCATPEERAKEMEGQAGPQTFTVTIQQMKFVPEDLYVNKGDTVVWINKDIVMHNVTEEVNKEWSSSPLAAGKSWKMAVEKAAEYFCSLHPVMKGKLLLK